MFSKTADPTAAPVRPTSSTVGGNTRSILSSDLRIVGEITSTGTVEILGEVEGSITAHGLIIGGEGSVSGLVNADTVEVKGKLEGGWTASPLPARGSPSGGGYLVFLL
jgi:cytoskeletal protein CcmA (bactofilin family)